MENHAQLSYEEWVYFFGEKSMQKHVLGLGQKVLYEQDVETYSPVEHNEDFR